MDDAENGRSGQRCEKCSRWDEIRDRVRLAELVKDAAEKVKSRWKEESFKPSLGDYLKLLQLEKEIDEEKITEIKVTWVSPEE